MSDKLYPTWINDRLPTEEDCKEEGDCLYYYIQETGYLYFCSWDYVEDGWHWAKAEGMTFHILQATGDIKKVATPQECLDRERGGDLEQALVKVPKKFKVLDGYYQDALEKIKDLEQEAEKWKSTAKTIDARNDELEETNHGLEQALAKSEERVKEVIGLVKHNSDKADFLREARDKEKEKVKELETENKYLLERGDKFGEENETLKKLLIKEWGG